jgi:hypothetical protein
MVGTQGYDIKENRMAGVIEGARLSRAHGKVLDFGFDDSIEIRLVGCLLSYPKLLTL